MTENATLERSWQRIPLTDEERTAIQARVREIGQRLQSSEKVYRHASLASQSSRYSITLSRSARMQSLAIGPAGLALFFAEMDRVLPGEGWDRIAHDYLIQAQEYALKEEANSFGLFSGTAGLLFTGMHLARSGPDAYFSETNQQLATAIFAALNKYFTSNNAPRPDAFSLTSGLVGVGVALLSLTEQQPSPTTSQARRYLERLVYHLTWLALRTRDGVIEQFGHWYPNTYLRETQARWLPEVAYAGTGMRRGLAGLIALLSLALESNLNINTEEVADALDWLCTRVSDEISEHDGNWQLAQDTEGDHYHRPGACVAFAWCNGTGGLARALSLAGRALDDEEFTDLAQAGIEQSIKRFRQDPLAVGPSLCHGTAGLLQVCTRFAGEAADAPFTADIQAMLQHILGLFEADRPFGYRSFEPEYIRVDTPWLLDGASGVALALLALLSPTAPDWDRILLLS